MIEIAHTAQLQQAYKAAHAERSQVFMKMLAWVFGARDVPLSKPALTEPSRCA